MKRNEISNEKRNVRRKKKKECTMETKGNKQSETSKRKKEMYADTKGNKRSETTERISDSRVKAENEGGNRRSTEKERTLFKLCCGSLEHYLICVVEA